MPQKGKEVLSTVPPSLFRQAQNVHMKSLSNYSGTEPEVYGFEIYSAYEPYSTFLTNILRELGKLSFDILGKKTVEYHVNNQKYNKDGLQLHLNDSRDTRSCESLTLIDLGDPH